MTVRSDGETIEDPVDASDPAPRLALGWLGGDSDPRRGACPPAALHALERAAQQPVARTRGWFRCPLCPAADLGPTAYVASGGERLLLGDAELEVRAGGAVWRAPTLVLHYVVSHGYLPPPEFLADVGGPR